MTFLKCTINGVKHGEKTVDHHEFETIVATGEQIKKQKSSDESSTTVEGRGGEVREGRGVEGEGEITVDE